MSKQAKQLYEFGPFLLDPAEHRLLRDGEPVAMTPLAFETLIALVERRGRLVEKEELLNILWPDSFVEEHNLANNVSTLRKALGEARNTAQYIETVPKRGYRFVAAVKELPPEMAVKDRARADVITEQDEEISTQAKSTDEAGSAVTENTRWRLENKPAPWVVAALVLAVGGVVGFYFSRHPTVPPMRVVPFTSLPNGAGAPAFSPDGNQIAFVGVGEKDNNDIYTQLVDGGNPLRLTSGPAQDTNPCWSHDGRRVAFVRVSGPKVEIFAVPALGGAERKLASLDEDSRWGYVTSLAWSPDGKFIAYSDRRSTDEPASLFLLSVEDLKKQRLTFPPERYWGDIHADFSRDGQSVAFLRFSSPLTEDIYIMPIAGGEARRLTADNTYINGFSWTEDGRDIIFASTREGGIPTLWRVSGSGGSPQRLSITGENAAGVCVAGRGNRLAYGQCFNPNSNIYRIDLPASPDRNASSIPLIHSLRHDNNPQISPDGKQIAFESDRAGGHEVWICDSDGSNPLQISSSSGRSAGSPRWSPDGGQIAFDSHLKGDGDIYIIDARGGNPRLLTNETSDEVLPGWSQDGRWIYFASNRTGSWQVWKMPVEGGAAVQLTRQGGGRSFESPDGKSLYYSKIDGPGIWRVPVEGGHETAVVDSYNGGWGNWALVADGVYFVKSKAGGAIEFYNFATKAVNQVAALGEVKLWTLGFAVSPDRQWLLYSQVDPGNTGNIMMVENFR